MTCNNQRGIDQKGNILLVALLLFGVVAIVSVSVAGYFYLQNQQLMHQEVVPQRTNVVIPAQTPYLSPSPSTQQDETANWKTYGYPSFGYSFKLPASYIITQNQHAPNENYIIQSLNLSESNASMGKNDYIITVQSQDLNSAVQNLIQKNGYSFDGTKVVNGKEWAFTSAPAEGVQYLTQFGNKTYTFNGWDSPLMESILPTFKFTQ